MCKKSSAQYPFFRTILRVEVSRVKLKPDVIKAVNTKAPHLQWHTPQSREVGHSQLRNGKDDPFFGCLFLRPSINDGLEPSVSSWLFFSATLMVHDQLEPSVSACFPHLSHSYGILYLVEVTGEL